MHENDSADDRAPAAPAETLDAIARDLVALKDAAGPVSYAELVRRITAQRVDRGMSAAAAQPPRTTVYDAFRPGRARIDVALLRDIVIALGGDEDEAERWVARYQRTRRTRDLVPRSSSALPAPAPARRASRAAAPLPAARPALRRDVAALILVACVAVNFAGMALVQALHLPIYLDMAGTAVAAMVFGPAPGILVGLATNVFGFVIGSPGAAPFALVNVAGAVVWAYGIRRWGMGADLFRYVNLTLLVAVACSLVGTPLGLLMFGGYSGHGSDGVTSSIEGLGLPVVFAAFSANLLTSVIDKLLSGFIALIGIAMLRSRLPIPTERLALVDRLIAPRAVDGLFHPAALMLPPGMARRLPVATAR
ncbi:ECF transporter S component [Microbacterium sp. cf332]|uniref:ECF transporter S component n=1 Tax=Microbacterium sp. cf332 TaxID=1761804 RepID=UPI0008843A63|nr:ECF transporter S component [Microbacterium sp. cf332]SDQ95352.1 energy-coupling factor transport system substrate-specific component [Microbacterium sp. cf332]